MPRVEFHAYFAGQFEALCADEDQLEVAGEIAALLDALERHGHDIEGETPGDPSHPIVISRLRTFALRRTPPTNYTPIGRRSFASPTSGSPTPAPQKSSPW